MRSTRTPAVFLVVLTMLAISGVGAGAQSPAAPEPSPSGSTVTMTPFERPGTDACWPDDPICLAACDTISLPTLPLDSYRCPVPHPDDSIRFTATLPGGWWTGGAGLYPPAGYSPPAGQAIHLGRGGWMFTDPCVTQARWDVGEGFPDILVGPSVDDFVDALLAHPAWEASSPVDVTLDGWSGTYLELQLPADVAGCMYWPWASRYFAQGPSDRWRLWVLDVDGVRVVIQAADFPGTPADDIAEKLAVVQSIRIEP